MLSFRRSSSSRTVWEIPSIRVFTSVNSCAEIICCSDWLFRYWVSSDRIVATVPFRLSRYSDSSS